MSPDTGRRCLSARAGALVLALLAMAACSRGAPVDLAAAREHLADARVVMLSTSWCSVCARLRADLDRWGVAYVDHDVESDPAARRAWQALQRPGVPVLLVGGERLVGYMPRRTLALLQQQGLAPRSPHPEAPTLPPAPRGSP